MPTIKGASPGLRTGAALVSLSLVLGLAACGSSGGKTGTTGAQTSGNSNATAPAIPDGPIKVGIIGALSGSGAAIGGLVKAQFTAYTEYLNANGGIAGHQVQLIFENSQSDPTTAVAAAKKLIQAGVVATLYNGSTSEGKEQVVALQQRAKIIGIAPEALGTYDDPAKYPYYFSDNAGNRDVTKALTAFAKTRGFDNFGVLGDSSPQANDYLSEFKKSVEGAGLKIASTTSYPTGATTMTTQLSSLKEAGAKTLALFCYSGCGQVFDSLRQIGWKPNVLVSPNIYYTAFKSVNSGYSDLTYSACPYSVKEGQEPAAGVTAAIDAIAPKVGGDSPLNQVYVQTADAYQILKYAIETANSLDGDAIRAALENMKDKSFVDPSVKFTFGPQTRFGYNAGTADGLMPICGFTSLGARQLPVRVAD